jgi:2-polyprenyl-6-hydroxyphenyl methylase/3-demethylubiquinone-9 3-methyltransferase
VEQLFGANRTELRLLDYGGGDGLMCSELRAGGLSDAHTYDPFVPDFAQRPAGEFDLVTCFETLEHMTDPMAGIASILLSMKDDGLVLFSTLVQIADFDKVGVGWWYVGPRNGHVSIFSRDALARAWQSHGCNIASFNENLHIAFHKLPPFAQHLMK